MPDYVNAVGAPPKPIAIVTISNPSSGDKLADIPMLIDSGADISVLPLSAAQLLNLSIAKKYEVSDFEGKSHVLDAFRADVLFEKRSFIGIFLAQSDSTGIIGRDILNDVRLILNGPAQSWELLS